MFRNRYLLQAYSVIRNYKTKINSEVNKDLLQGSCIVTKFYNYSIVKRYVNKNNRITKKKLKFKKVQAQAERIELAACALHPYPLLGDRLLIYYLPEGI